MHKYLKLGQRSLEVGTTARRAWNDVKLFRGSNSLHLVWGKLSILYKSDFDCTSCRDAYEVNGHACQDCCPHGDSRDHGICIDCGHEEDPGAAIDHAMSMYEDR